MKKSFYLFAAIAFMASCSQEEVLVNNLEADAGVSRLIGFETFVDKATRATYENNSTALDFFYPTFNVYGWKTVGSDVTCVFEDITVSYYNADNAAETTTPGSEWGESPATGWYYNDIRYWDKMATSYQFSAYAPSTAAAACEADGTITIGTAEAPVTVDAKNLMDEPATELAFTGFDSDYMTATSTVAASPVALIFKHLQAKLNIRILLDDEVTTAQNVAIQNIEVHNLGNKAYYTNDDAVGVSGWTLVEGDADYVPSITAVEDGYSLNDATANFNEYYVLEQLIIPQTLTKYAGNDAASIAEYTEACIYVEYTIGDETFKSYSPLANIFIGEGNATDYTFMGGNQYTLNITVGPKPIEFTAEVSSWTEGADTGLLMD